MQNHTPMIAYLSVMPEKSAEENLRIPILVEPWWCYCCTIQLIAHMKINDLGEQRWISSDYFLHF